MGEAGRPADPAVISAVLIIPRDRWRPVRLVLWEVASEFSQPERRRFEFLGRLLDGQLIQVEVRIDKIHLDQATTGRNMPQFWEIRVYAVSQDLFEARYSGNHRWSAVQAALGFERPEEIQFSDDRVLPDCGRVQDLTDLLQGEVIRIVRASRGDDWG